MKPGFSEQTMKSRFTARKAVIRAGMGKYPSFGRFRMGREMGRPQTEDLESESLCFLRAVTESGKQRKNGFETLTK